MRGNLLLLAVSIGLSMLLLEGALRLISDERPRGAVASPEAFFERHPELGWAFRPGVDAHYAAGECVGRVTIDEDGNRRNSAEGTYRQSHADIFFIGDSTAAALEVDDDQTVPALLEQGLRRRGLEVNVLNLGVRGYGTDQAVRKALLQAGRYRPVDVVYLFTDNDVFDNNVLRQPKRRFGKGVYRRDEGGGFAALNYPVPDYERGFYGAVILDEDGRPRVYSGTSADDERPATGATARLDARLRRSLHAYRALARLRRALWPTAHDRNLRRWKELGADPSEVARDAGHDPTDVFYALFWGTVDGGRGRQRHGEYYAAQLEHLLGLLRGIESVRRLHLVAFPVETTLELLAAGEPSTNRRLFEDLLARGRIDGYVDLNRAMLDSGLAIRDLKCRGDFHFSERGNRWIAEVLLGRLDFAEAAG